MIVGGAKRFWLKRCWSSTLARTGSKGAGACLTARPLAVYAGNAGSEGMANILLIDLSKCMSRSCKGLYLTVKKVLQNLRARSPRGTWDGSRTLSARRRFSQHRSPSVCHNFSICTKYLHTMADCELLVVAVDACKSSWTPLDAAAAALEEAARLGASSSADAAASRAERRSTFPEFLVALQLFLGAFATNSRKNDLVVLAYNGVEGGYVFPSAPMDTSKVMAQDTLGNALRPGAISKQVDKSLMRLRYGELLDKASAAASSGGGSGGGAGGGWSTTADVSADASGDALMSGSDGSSGSSSGAIPSASSSGAGAGAGAHLDGRFASLPSVLAQGVCYIHRVRKLRPRLRARILVFQAGPDLPSQYIPLINVAYSCQRHNIPLDSCLLGAVPSVLLQQAAHLTAGQHCAPEAKQHAGLLQYLLTLLLPDAALRSTRLLMPPQHDVNLRAHCFCHKAHKTTAWLCTTCLSIWCAAHAVCPTCGTRTGSAGPATAAASSGGAGAAAAAEGSG